MHDEGTDSRVKIFANVFISFIGAGILGLPYAFKEAGLIEGIVIMSAIGTFSVKAMLLLIDCKDRLNFQSSLASLNIVPSRTTQKSSNGRNGASPTSGAHHIDYGDVGYAALGTSGKLLVDLSIVISQVGFCCAYLIFILENLHSLLPSIPQLGFLLTLLIPLAFLTNLRHLKHLAPFSLFADFANVFAYSIVFYFDMKHFHLVKFHIKNYSLEGLPFFLGIAIYCYEGAGLILSLEASVAKEVRGSFRGLFKLAISLITLLYIVFAVCGYLSFGPDTESIITLNLPEGVFPLVVKGCLCFSLFFTYPIMMFPVSNILERNLCFPVNQPYTEYLLGTVLRTGLVFLTGLIVVCIPSFSTMMALVGSSCCTLLAFILPGIFHWRIFKGELSFWSAAMDIFLIILGITGAIIGTRDAISRMFKDKTTSRIPTPSDPSPTTASLASTVGITQNGTAATH